MSLVLVKRYGGEWIKSEDGLMERADWKWKSAQPGDMWVPKRKWEGVLLRVPSAMGSKEYRCEPLIVKQSHNADKAMLCVDECDRLRSVKWTALRKYWKPVTVREFPALVVEDCTGEWA